MTFGLGKGLSIQFDSKEKISSACRLNYDSLRSISRCSDTGDGLICVDTPPTLNSAAGVLASVALPPCSDRPTKVLLRRFQQSALCVCVCAPFHFARYHTHKLFSQISSVSEASLILETFGAEFCKGTTNTTNKYSKTFLHFL